MFKEKQNSNWKKFLTFSFGNKDNKDAKEQPEEKTPQEKINTKQILKLTEGTLAPVSCLKDDSVPCDRSELCYTLPIWQGLADLINNYFDNMTLADVAGKAGQTVKE